MSIPETPRNRLEMYLDEIARNGGGGGGGGGSSALSGLTDVDISNPTNGQTLVYNATSGKWENGEGSGGASLVMPNISITMTGEDTATATCDMTRAAIVSAIEDGAICIARITGWGPPSIYKFANVALVNEGMEGPLPMLPAVSFVTYEMMGGGDVLWATISILDNGCEVSFDYTISYNE